MRRLLLTIPLALSLTLFNCAGKRRKPVEPPAAVLSVTSGASADRMAAIAELEAMAASSDEETRPWALLYAGEQRRLAGDLAESRTWFSELANDFPTHTLKSPAILGIALIDGEGGLSGNTLATLQLMDEAGVPGTMNADRYRILARLAADEGSNSGDVRELVRKAVVFAQGDPLVESRVKRSLADLLDEEQDSSLDSGTELVGAELLAAERIRADLADRELAQVLTQSARFLETWPDSEFSGEIRALQRRAEAGDPVVDGKVGVLLPLSGDYAPAAARLRKSMEHAAAGSGITLVFRDTGGKPETAVAALETLVLEDGVVAVVGPLTKDSVLPTAEAAQDFRVPLVTLSQSGRPPEVGEFIYRGFLPMEQQVDALVEHSVTERAWQRFAVLHPNTPYGESASELFKAAVESRGGEVTIVVGYDPKASDFLGPARELGQKDYTVRAAEYRRIKRDYEEKGFDVDKAVLPPIVEFDAIFIPDNWRRVALVASSLAYEEFPVGGFRPDRRAEPIPLLGLNAWNDPRIVEAGAQYVKYAIFVDAFLPGSRDATTQGFVGDYKSEFGRPPGILDALAHDTIRITARAVTGAGANREEAKAQLDQVDIADAVAGGGSFGEDREVSRELLMLTIGKNGIGPWVAPEELLPEDGMPAPE